MLFSSTEFVFFFLPILLFLYYLCFHHRRLKNFVLTIASLLFYAYGEPKFIFLMLSVIFITWIGGLLVEKYHERKKILILFIVLNISILIFFKYLNFLTETLNMVVGGFPHLAITLPIGISFFIFQAISYIIDVYRKSAIAQHNPIYVAEYISLFPQLIAGPIVRYETIAQEISSRKENMADFERGCCRFVVGFSKKILFANAFSVVSDLMFNSVADGKLLSVFSAWLGAISYTLQIYYDFSGYSDMAIGLGLMFGFHFLENFNYPYISKSITEFWRRWHISLGTWFRDYIYFPLGGSRVDSRIKLWRNLFIVWLLTGFWHGANWTFILWGLMYFVLIGIEKIINLPSHANIITWFYTMFFVIIGWTIFRSDSVLMAIHYILMLFGINNSKVKLLDDLSMFAICEYGVLIFVGCLFSFPVHQLYMKYISKKGIVVGIYNSIYIIGIISLFLISCSFLIKGGHNPFIYFNF